MGKKELARVWWIRKQREVCWMRKKAVGVENGLRIC